VCYYTIIKNLGNDLFQLKILKGWRGLNVFYTDRLYRYVNNLLPGQEYKRLNGKYVGLRDDLKGLLPPLDVVNPGEDDPGTPNFRPPDLLKKE
jgi:hypothetical protein